MYGLQANAHQALSKLGGIRYGYTVVIQRALCPLTWDAVLDMYGLGLAAA